MANTTIERPNQLVYRKVFNDLLRLSISNMEDDLEPDTVTPSVGKYVGHSWASRFHSKMVHYSGRSESARGFQKYREIETVPYVSERRKALLARAPSRQQIKTLMDRLPPCDEWLDDKYDQSF